jgi:hypothetical protein
MVLLIFSYLIIIANLVFFGVGILNDIGVVGAIAGGLMAIGSDTVIIFMAIIIGTGLVVHQSRFSILYFMLAAIVGAAAVHYFLGTTKLIVDIIRVDVLLIIPALIVIVTSFFIPKTKSKIKYVELPIHKPIRIIILLAAATVSFLVLFISNQNINHTLFGKYISRPILYPMYLTRGITWCEETCKTVRERDLYSSGKITKKELNKKIKSGEIKVKYDVMHFGNRKQGQWIVHTIVFFIFMTFVWKLRFCIAYVITTPMFTPKQKPTKSDFNLAKTIKNFIKKI